MDPHTINFELDNSFIPKYEYKLPPELKSQYSDSDYEKGIQIKNKYYPKIHIVTGDKTNLDKTYINKKQVNDLKESKNQIDKYYNDKLWDKIKKNTNPYEIIYITNKRHRKYSISTYEPLSRSYFKMVEICHEFFNNIISLSEPIITTHLAEGPGGFMEAILQIRNNPEDKIFGMTLIADSKEVPGWHRANIMLNQNPNIRILTGLDNTGDLYNIQNLNYLRNRIGTNSSHIITGDGGFDFSVDYNKQEFYAQKLIFSQVIGALKVQKIGCHFVCKMFDNYTYITNEIIYILMTLYEKVNIFKPYTSRTANSEKYIVCRGFKGIDPFYMFELNNILDIWNRKPDRVELYSLLHYLPKEFIDQINKINNSIQKQQITFINKTIDHIKKPLKKNEIIKNIDSQIKNATLWCKKYNIPYRRIICNNHDLYFYYS